MQKRKKKKTSRKIENKEKKHLNKINFFNSRHENKKTGTNEKI